MKSTLPLYDLAGKTVGEMALDAAVFNKPASADLIHQVIVTMQNNRRPVIASTKDRGQVSGTGKKPWKQKGTGQARVGSARSPIWRGGGTTFGPNNDRNFVTRLPQKMRQAAWRGILTDKVSADNLILIDSFSDLDGKTKSWTTARTTLTAALPQFAKKTLIIDAEKGELAERSIRNTETSHYTGLNAVNLYDLMRFPTIVLTKAALEVLTLRLAPATKKAAA